MATAIYVRVSNPSQESNYSLSTQEELCREYATKNNLTVERVFTETHTGVDLWERPQLSELRTAIQHRYFSNVIFFELGRFSRDPGHMLIVMAEAEYYGCQIHIVLDSVDRTPVGQAVQFIKGFAKHQEWVDLNERTYRGRMARVKSGKYPASPRAPFGYRWTDDTKASLTIDEEQAITVRLIFDLYTSGMSLRKLTRYLNEQQVPTPSGKSKWQPVSIRYLLKSERYIGKAYAQKHANGGSQLHSPKTWLELPEGIIPPIIEESTFYRAQERLRDGKQKALRNTKEPEVALLRGGYIRCGYCNSVMRVKEPKQEKQFRYHHQTRSNTGEIVCDHRPTISVPIADNHVWQLVTRFLQEPERIREALENTSTDDPTAHDVQAIDRAIQRSEKQQSNLLQAIAITDNRDVQSTLLQQLDEVRTRTAKLEDERRTLLDRQLSWEQAQHQIEGIEAWCKTVSNNHATLTWAEQRAILDRLGVTAYLYLRNDEQEGERLKIVAKVPLDNGKETVYTTTYGSAHSFIRLRLPATRTSVRI